MPHHVVTFRYLVHVVGRGVEVEQHLGAGLNGLLNRAIYPNIFANGYPDAATGCTDYTGLATRSEIAFLIEYAVVGQILLVITTEFDSITKNNRRVVQASLRLYRAPDHRGDAL